MGVEFFNKNAREELNFLFSTREMVLFLSLLIAHLRRSASDTRSSNSKRYRFAIFFTTRTDRKLWVSFQSIRIARTACPYAHQTMFTMIVEIYEGPVCGFLPAAVSFRFVVSLNGGKKKIETFARTVLAVCPNNPCHWTVLRECVRHVDRSFRMAKRDDWNKPARLNQGIF